MRGDAAIVVGIGTIDRADAEWKTQALQSDRSETIVDEEMGAVDKACLVTHQKERCCRHFFRLAHAALLGWKVASETLSLMRCSFWRSN
jgi:hypothetical protein